MSLSVSLTVQPCRSAVRQQRRGLLGKVRQLPVAPVVLPRDGAAHPAGVHRVACEPVQAPHRAGTLAEPLCASGRSPSCPSQLDCQTFRYMSAYQQPFYMLQATMPQRSSTVASSAPIRVLTRGTATVVLGGGSRRTVAACCWLAAWNDREVCVCSCWQMISLSIDFYIRVFVRVYTSAAEVKNAGTKLAYVYQSQGCESFYLQRLARKVIAKHAPSRRVMSC